MSMTGVLEMPATKASAQDGAAKPTPFGRKMKASREKRGWSQTDLADRAGVSRGYVALHETGRRPNPQRDEVVKIAQAFSEPPDEWLRTAGFDVPVSAPQGRSFHATVDQDPSLTAEQKNMLKSLYISFTGVRPSSSRRRRRL